MFNNKNARLAKLFAYIVLIFAMLCCLIPLMVIISASLSTESELMKYGYSVFPRGLTFNAYKAIFQSPDMLLDAYGTTILITVIGTFGSLLITMLAAYPLSRKDFKWRNIINFYFYFTMLFSGGMIPGYILMTQYLKLQNTLAALILPLLFNVWNMFLLRTYFSSIDKSIIESAKIDGASEYKIFFIIASPLAKVGIATIAFRTCMTYWNDWFNCFMYITNGEHITLQYFLNEMLSHIEAMLKTSEQGVAGVDLSALPSESIRMAMCILAIGPMLFLFMFFQKYFTSGIAVGSVKG